MSNPAYRETTHELERLNALFQYNILDTSSEEEFDNIAKIASYICKTPIAFIAFIDDRRQWFKSTFGIDITEVDRSITVCQNTISGNSINEIPDLLENEHFKDHVKIKGENGYRYYAGAPLKTPEGFNIGTLCVLDRCPRHLSEDQKMALTTLAQQVINQLELKKKNLTLQSEVEKLSKRALDNITNELNSYKLALDETSAVIITDHKGIIHFVNDATCRLTRYSKQELIGNDYRIINSDFKSDAFFEKFWKRITAGKIWKNQVQNKAKDGTFYWADTTIVPFITENGKPFKFVGILRDITENKKVEIELIKAKNIAEKAVHAKDNFLANMSHEIRTPMNAIIGFTDLLAQTNLNSQQREYVNNVQTAGENLLLIINDILDLSKIESGKLGIEAHPFNLKHTLKHVYDLLKVKAKEKELDFNLFLDPELPEHVIGDNGRINQILVNLAGNAIKFTEKGEVTISVKLTSETDKDATIRFSVRDTGIGISQSNLSIIFDRFTQAEESTTRRFGGTGLGLNIVKQLIELQQGRIEVKSEEGRGSDFFFSLTFPKATGIHSREHQKQVPKCQHLGKLNILLCEDNDLNQRLAKNILELFGFDLTIANNGQEGIDQFLKKEFDLILMDLQMPVMDGYQTTTHIRQTLHSDIPIIAMTAHSLVGEQEKCFELGMNGYVAKPFKQEQLLTAIETVLSGRSKKPEVVQTKMAVQPAFSQIQMDYLKEVSNGHKGFEKEMIELFIDKVPADFRLLENAIEGEDFDTVREMAHKLKSSYSLFRLHHELDCLKQLETEARTPPMSRETLQLFYPMKQELSKTLFKLEIILATNYSMT